MPGKVLLIAFHFPPVKMSSGVQRTLKNCRYLPQFDWETAVLSVSPRAYPAISRDQIGEIPKGLLIHRALALDTSRHLAIAGRYPATLALPDRYVTWVVGGVVGGLRMIRKFKPDVIWSTYPIASAHLIGMILSRVSGIPWIADCRDSITEDHYPRDERRRSVFRWIEKKMVRHADIVTFTTSGTVRMYSDRYPHEASDKWRLIPNGFDEENFLAAQESPSQPYVPHGELRLVHSGLLYPIERDPTAFFGALRALKARRVLEIYKLKIILRASGNEARYKKMIREFGLEQNVSLEPPISYQAALQEMLHADGLLIFQSKGCNHQIPAKAYEYLRSGRPIMALTDSAGDTASLLRAADIRDIVPLDDERLIEQGIERFVEKITAGTIKPPPAQFVAGLSRRARTEQLANLLDQVKGSRKGSPL